MTYRQFRNWCNDRAADGCWGYIEANYCLGVLRFMQNLPFWKRRKAWKAIKDWVVNEFVKPTNEKIQEAMNPWTEDLFAGYKFEED